MTEGERPVDRERARRDEPVESAPRNRALSALSDLNDLSVFSRVVEASGFSRAARQLGVPASTVSRRVARLEEELGVRLLQRTTRTMHLTDAGRNYYEQVSRALGELESAEASLRAVQGSPRGLVRVSTISEPFLESVLLDFMDHYPDVSLEIDKSYERVDLVGEGFDLALRTGVLADSSLIAHKLMSSATVLCASPDYLKERGTPRNAGELRDHDCVILGSSVATATWHLRAADGGIQRIAVSGRLAVNHFSSAVAACRRGFGIGFFPRAYIDEWIKAKELVLFLPDSAPTAWALWLVYPSKKLLSPAVRALIDFIKDSFSKPTRSA